MSMVRARIAGFFRPKLSEQLTVAIEEHSRAVRESHDMTRRNASLADDVIRNVESTRAVLRRSWGEEI